MSSTKALFGMNWVILRGLWMCMMYAASTSQHITRAELSYEKPPEPCCPVVQTESGAVVGKIETLLHGKTVYEYLGIPYAEPPVGELRFAAPIPVKRWSGIKDAMEYGASCPQSTRHINKSDRLSEDCLFLNVFVPSTAEPEAKLAVMVWIHGGRFALGSSSHYPGGVLAAFNDVIVVSLNYRLGILGFLNVPGTEVKGNYGIMDQVLAMKWVQANIQRFGGDPNRVTIFGQDAGAMSVSLHLISPLSRGLFQRAIMQSGASSTPLFNGKVKNTEQLELFSKMVNCSLGPSLVECIRDKTFEDIVEEQWVLTLENYLSKSIQDIVGPIVDGELLPDFPENLFKTGKFHTDATVMTGVTSDEGAVFALFRRPAQIGDAPGSLETMIQFQLLYARETNEAVEDLIAFEYRNHTEGNIFDSISEVYGDSAFVAPAILEATAMAKGGRPPYVYVFDHREVYSTLPEDMGVIHYMDVPFVFGAPFRNQPSPALTGNLATKYSETEKGFSMYVMKLWTDFAKYGSPNPSSESVPAPVTWPAFTEQNQEYLVIALKPKVKRRYKAKRMAFWNEILPKVAEFTKGITNNKIGDMQTRGQHRRWD